MKFKRELFEITKFEIAEEKDHFDVSYILASSVTNGNGALISDTELSSAKDSILHQPLIVVPDWDNLPTGHSIEEFPKLGWGAVSVGTHIASEIIEGEDGVHHLKATARVWKIRHPELAEVMLNLFEAGDLKFSMEAKFNSQTIEGATRTLHGVHFIGSAVVNDPANPFSYALEVANKREQQKEEKVVNFEQAMELLKKHDADAYVLIKDEIANLKTKAEKADKVEGLENDKTSLASSLEQANGTIDTLKNEISTLKKEKEDKELAEKQEKRYSEIAQFITFEEEEVASKKESFGKMDEDTWNLVLETAKRNKKEDNSNVSFSTDTKLETSSQKGFLDFLGE